MRTVKQFIARIKNIDMIIPEDILIAYNNEQYFIVNNSIKLQKANPNIICNELVKNYYFVKPENFNDCVKE